MLVRKTVTALFCDLTDSTGLGERLDPESHRHVVTRYFDEMRDAIERHGGTVEKFIGDAVMALFGVPVVHEDDALRAVRAAVEMRRRVSELSGELHESFGVELDVGIGVNTGEVVVGGETVGGTLATGDAITVAARLQQAAKPGEILIGTATYPLVRDAVNVGPARKYRLKGKAEEVATWRLDRVDARAAGIARRLDAPLVDRADELRRLQEAFDATVRERSCRLVTVLGPAGIGKSRLAGELLSMLDGRASAVTGRCLPYGEGITYWPLVEIVRTLGGGLSLDEVLAGHEDADSIAQLVRGAVGDSAASRAPEETFWAVRRLLEALAEQRPLVVCLEDIHWAEPTLLDLIEYLADWSHTAPILLLCLARPDLLELRPTWLNPRQNAVVLVLEPLSESDADALVDSLRGDVELDDDARGRIARAGEGNPLYVEQMVAMIAEDPTAVGWAAVPASIQALLQERLDRLSPHEREVIERAALIGREFPHDAVAELVAPELSTSVATVLLGLVRRGLLAPNPSGAAGQDGYRFRHMLIRDAAYESMPREVRAVLHERLANWIERTPGEGAELDEIAGYHLEQAVLHRARLGPPDAVREIGTRAASLLSSAGRRAFARADMPAAVALLTRATVLVGDDERARVELAPDLAAALAESGELAAAEGVLEQAIRDVAGLSDPRLEWAARVGNLLIRVRTQPSEDLLHEAEQAIAIFTELGDERGLALAWRGLSAMHWLASRWGARTEALEQALAHARRADDRREEAIALGSLGLSLYWGPTPVDTAVERCGEILDEARGDRTVNGRILAVLAGLHGMQGRFDSARDLYAQSKSNLEELALPVLVGTHTLVYGSTELLAGRPAEAERELRRGCELLEGIGERTGLATLIAVRAEAVLAQGRLDEAERLTRASAETTAPEDVANQTLWRSTRAKVLARQADVEGGQTLAREAVALASTTDALNLHADALVALADVLAAGESDEAEEALEDAFDLYEAKGNRVAAAATYERLERLRTGRAVGTPTRPPTP